MRFLFLLGILIIPSILIYAQPNWETLNPSPSYEIGIDVFFVSSDTGYIINEHEILITTNAGTIWSVKQDIISANAFDIKGNTAFIVGNNHTIYKSINKGVSWIKLPFSGNSHYKSVSVIDDNHIFISTDYSLLKTSDGGVTWQSSIIPNVLVKKVLFVDNLVGHAICASGKILKTIDAGQNWYVTESTNTSPSDFYDIYFVDNNIGYASREHFYILKTTNGGESWVEISYPYRAMFDFHFFNANEGIMAGEYGAVYKTIDGGNTWTYLNPQDGLIDQNDVNAIYFLNQNEGYAVGLKGRILKTTDGGNTWNEYGTNYKDIDQIQFTSSNNGYMLSQEQFYKTIDGGINWSIINNPNHISYSNGFFFSNDILGYSIGGGIRGEVYKTINGGTNWTKAHSTPYVIDEALNSIFFIDSMNGFVSGGYNSKGVFKTTNGGISWQKKASYAFSQMQFTSATTGFAITKGTGDIYKTTDGGETWTLNYDDNYRLTSLHFLDDNNGFVVGIYGLMYHTNNGGNTWNTVTIPYGDFELVKFKDNQLGYVVDDNGKLYQTTDGGLTWNLLIQLYQTYDIEIVEPYIYLAGTNGKLVRNNIFILSNTNSIEKEMANIIIFPNPTHDLINIEVNSSQIITSIEVFDLQGRRLPQKYIKTQSNRNQIDVSSNAKGIYFLKVQLDDGSFVTKTFIIN